MFHPTPLVSAVSLLLVSGFFSSAAPLLHAGAVAAMTAQPEGDLDIRIRAAAAESNGRVTLESMGTSREGRPLHVLRVGAEGKPSLLIVAGLNAMHTVGIEAALGVARKIGAEHAGLLETHSVYVLPCADPDTLERLKTASPRRESARKISPVDDDRDARVDEDPPADLNGDGVISVMRVYNPPPASGIEATEVIDSTDPRLTRKPDRMKGEAANVAILVEGRDHDGDGLIAEDGVDGTDLTTNFPWKWPEFKDGAGPSPLCEPETRAIAEWLYAHDNVVAVLVFGPHDNLVKTPDAGRFDASGRVPEGIENDDKPYYEEIGKIFKEVTRMTGAPSNDPGGSLHGWAYAHMGLYSFATPVWVRPDLVKQEEGASAAPAPDAAPKDDADKPGEPTDAEIQEMIAEFQSAPREQRRALMEKLRTMPPAVQDRVRASMSGRGGGGAAGAAGRPTRPQAGAPASDADDAKWLKYSDESRNGEGFIAFQPFEHPQLGPVEIGGFVPGFKLNPPSSELPGLIDQQTAFVAALMSKLPRIEVSEPTVESLGADLWRVTIRVSNTGYLPSRAAIAGKTRRLPSLRVQLDVPEDRVLAGDRLTRVPALPGSGGSRIIQWVVRGEENSVIGANVKAGEYADSPVSITLRQQLHTSGPIPQPPPDPAPDAVEKKEATR